MMIGLGSEADLIVFTLGRRVHPRSGAPVVRALFDIALKELLPKGSAELFEEVAKLSEDRKVPRDRVLLLRDVTHRDRGECRHNEPDDSEREKHDGPGTVSGA